MAFRDNTENKRRFNRLRSYLGDNFGNRLLKEILNELEKEDDISIQTYDSLKATKENNQLVAGKKYLMSNFQTIHIIPNTVDENTVQDSDTFYARGASQAGASSLTTANLTLAIKNIGEPLGFGFSLGNIDVSAGNNYGKAEIIAGIKANFLDLFHPEGNADLEMFVSVDASDNLNATLKTSTDFDLDLREYIEVSGSGFTLQWGTFETVEAWQPELEPLILTAISSSEFDAEVKSPLYPQDSIWYDIDSARWGAYESPNSKGKIIRRVDNITRVDVSQDFRNVRLRRWNLDLSTYGGSDGITYPNYVAWDTSIAVGHASGVSNGVLTLNCIESGDYKDMLMFPNYDDDPSGVWENTIRHPVNQTICNAVFEGKSHHIDWRVLYAGVHAQRPLQTFSPRAGGNFLLFIQLNEFVTDNIKTFSSSQSQIKFWTTILIGVGGIDMIWRGSRMVNLTLFNSNTSITKTINRFSYFESVTNLYIEHSGTATNINIVYSNTSYLRQQTTQSHNINTTDTEDFVVIKDLYIPTFAGNLDFGTNYPNQVIKYTPTNSNITRTFAAASVIPQDYHNWYDGIWDLTGTGTVVIESTAGNSHYNKLVRPPIMVKPQAGLIVQIAHNDVSRGFLTNNQTYEANGTNGEYIIIEWRGDLDRYIVLSGRTTP